MGNCCGRNFRALLWRNFIYRKRHYIGSLFQLLLPIAVVALLLVIKKLVQSTAAFERTVVPPSFPKNEEVVKMPSFLDYVTALQATRVCTQRRQTTTLPLPPFLQNADEETITAWMEDNNITMEELKMMGQMIAQDDSDNDNENDDVDFQISGIDFGWPVPFVKCDSNKCSYEGQDAVPFCSYPMFAIVPASENENQEDSSTFTTTAQQRTQSFIQYIYDTYPQLEQSDRFRFNHSFINDTFTTEAQLEQYVTSQPYSLSAENPSVGVAVVLSGGSDHSYQYKIRINSTNFNHPEESAQPAAVTTPSTRELFDAFAKDKDDSCNGEGGVPEQGKEGGSCYGQYMLNGALPIQRLIDDWIIHETGAADLGYAVSENGVSFVSFPTRQYTKDGFYATINAFVPLLVVLGLMYPVASCIRFVVSEKELRQKELLKMMSVTEFDIGWSWFVSFYAFYFFSGLGMAIVSSALYEETAFGLLFVFWQLVFMAIIVFAFVIAAVSSKATRGTLIGILAFFVGYILPTAVSYEEYSTGILNLCALHPVAAFSYGVQIIGMLEDEGAGLTADTLSFSNTRSGYTFNTALGSLIFDIILWGIVGWYLNRVIAADYGQPEKWYFPFTKSYWMGNANASDGYDEEAEEQNNDTSSFIPIEPVSDALKQQEVEGKAVIIRNLRKMYGEKTAVDGVNLSMYTNQVTALLGHNGAGKTTTINMLTGMVGPSSGYALVAGRDIRHQMTEIRQNIGICLQHDCLFPLLTVKEHIQLFVAIKGMYQDKSREEIDASINRTIEDVALLEKSNTYSKNLSGGMKRKLSVAIAFCGDSKVVFLDEPTSGMDPFSRRFTWNVIRQYRQDRCIILTTHFMDEADLLGDRIAILSEGQLRCVGSPLFLKKAFHVGYQLTIEKQPLSRNEVSLEDNTLSTTTDVVTELRDIVAGTISNASELSNVGTEISFQLPISSSEHFTEMFKQLDEKVDSGSIVTYGVSITTLESVFLMVARGETGKDLHMRSSVRGDIASKEDIVPASDDDRSQTTGSFMEQSTESSVFARHVQALFEKRAMNFKRDRKAWWCSTLLPCIFTFIGFVTVRFASPYRNMEPLTLSLADYNIDTADSSQRNPISFNSAEESFPCIPGTCLFENYVHVNGTSNKTYFYCGVSDDTTDDLDICSISQSNDLMSGVGPENGAFAVPQSSSNISESSRNIYNTSTAYAASQYGAIFFTHDSSSAILNRNATNKTLLFDDMVEGWCSSTVENNDYVNESQCPRFRGLGYVVATNFTAIHASLLYQALADQSIVREATNNEDFSITATIHPLPTTNVERGFSKAADAFFSWFLMVLSFPFITGAFATFIVSERLSKAKHLQTVAGVKPEAYWVSSFLWDVLNYQLPLWIVVILIFAFDIEVLTTSEHGAAVGTIVLLIMFGPAAAGFTYVITFLFKSPSACNLFVIIFNFFIGMVGSLVCFILRIIQFGVDASTPPGTPVKGTDFRAIAETIEWILRFIPSFGFAKGLLYLMNIELFVASKPDENVTVWTKEVILLEVIFMALETVGYLALAIQLDKWSTNPRAVQLWKCFVRFLTCRCCFFKKHEALVVDSEVPDDEDVIAEAERVRSGDANSDQIVLSNLTKEFPGKLAVNGLSLGIPPGQCFGLLGINGAGKTTTMAMLTAEFPPTDGDATLAGHSVTEEPEKTRRKIGYCPQFDAHFMNMTGREHVELYAGIKGVSKEFVKEAAAAKLKEVGLSEADSDRLSSGYSGGMKRKLSVACATIGHPSIVFLDEPSTGMDPVSRRDLWKVISDMVIGRESQDPNEKTSVILTTHSMEECEALCPRIGIMAGGKLRCLGSAQHLKTRFGKGFQVEVKIKEVLEDDEDYRVTLAKLANPDGSTAKGGDGDNNDADGEAALSSAGNTMMHLADARAALRVLTNDDYLSSMITEDNPTGYVIFKAAASAVGVPLDELAVFCTEELRVRNLISFFQATYPNSVLRERQDNKVRYEVESEGLKISSLFAAVENKKQDLMLMDYGISQTSLEQVFNMHAAEAEKAKQGTVDGS